MMVVEELRGSEVFWLFSSG